MSRLGFCLSAAISAAAWSSSPARAGDGAGASAERRYAVAYCSSAPSGGDRTLALDAVVIDGPVLGLESSGQHLSTRLTASFLGAHLVNGRQGAVLVEVGRSRLELAGEHLAIESILLLPAEEKVRVWYYAPDRPPEDLAATTLENCEISNTALLLRGRL